MKIDERYIVFESDDKDLELSQLEILFNRVGRISKILYDKKPTLIPFKFSFPIMDINEQNIFVQTCSQNFLFEDLPEHYKQKVIQSEKVNFYNLKFLEYLKDKQMSENLFASKNPKTKMDIFYDFLFSNKMDVGILD